MNIAIYGKSVDKKFQNRILELFQTLNDHKINFIIYKPFIEFIKSSLSIDLKRVNVFSGYNDIEKNIDYLFSIGGDGTFLEAVAIVRNTGIPVVGINAGRLGFLASISEKEIKNAISLISDKKYSIEERILIELEIIGKETFNDFNHALNEITIQKKDNTMIKIHVYANKEYLNSYWADGLIISTPTGSTAYSLSVGGPIIVPESENIIISPISPHNLTVRPIVFPGNTELELKIESRSKKFLTSLDYKSKIFTTASTIKIKKSDFKIKTLKIDHTSFYATLRNKLMWGQDNRN